MNETASIHDEYDVDPFMMNMMWMTVNLLMAQQVDFDGQHLS
jgi:hypothetical protein